MDLQEIECLCVADFKRSDYAVCAQTVMDLSLPERGTTPLLLQLNLISFQRIGYAQGVVQCGSLALSMLERHPWHRDLIQITLGQKDLSGVICSAQNPIMFCEAYFYAGARFLTQAFNTADDASRSMAVEKAHELFRRAMETGAPCFECELAAFEYRRLNGEPPEASPTSAHISEEFDY